MSRRGRCHDNATMESCWATLKAGLVQDWVFDSRAQAKSARFDYLECFYNRRRLHGALGCQTPVEYETNLG